TTTTSSTAAAHSVRTMRERKVSPFSSGRLALGRPIRVDLPAASTIAGITVPIIENLCKNRVHDRRRPSNPLSALRHTNGHARSRSWHAVDAGSVLGLSALRPAFLVHLSTTKPREGQGGLGARIMIGRDVLSELFTEPLRVDDDDL